MIQNENWKCGTIKMLHKMQVFGKQSKKVTSEVEWFQVPKR